MNDYEELPRYSDWPHAIILMFFGAAMLLFVIVVWVFIEKGTTSSDVFWGLAMFVIFGILFLGTGLDIARNQRREDHRRLH